MVRKCEDLLYELSLSGKYAPRVSTASAGAPAAKRARTAEGAETGGAETGGAAAREEDLPRIRPADFDTIKAELEAYDKRREQIIKQSRDVQKLSKNAIYSLHRDPGPEGKAAAQLDQAAGLASAIVAELVEDCPSLRTEGSYSNCMEECENVPQIQRSRVFGPSY